MRGIFMDIKEKSESKYKTREEKFIRVFLVQSIVCLMIICSALILKYSRPDTFETVSSVLNGFYENNITLSDLNKIIDEKILGSETVSAFFNFTPAQ